MSFPLSIATALLTVATVGCQQTEELRFVASKEVAGLTDKLQQSIGVDLEKCCGTPLVPQWIEDHGLSNQHLRRGAEVYQEHCTACYGTTEDGAEPSTSVAAFIPKLAPAIDD
jgi:hypothetical protein